MNAHAPSLRFPGRRIVLASAVYDLLVTTPFATPWSALWLLSSLAAVQRALGLGGDPLPAFLPAHLFFVGLLGSVVTTWGLLRLLRPSAWFGKADGYTRLVFSAWMLWALAHGASHLLIGLLVVEFGLGVLQLTRVRELP